MAAIVNSEGGYGRREEGKREEDGTDTRSSSSPLSSRKEEGRLVGMASMDGQKGQGKVEIRERRARRSKGGERRGEDGDSGVGTLATRASQNSGTEGQECTPAQAHNRREHQQRKTHNE